MALLLAPYNNAMRLGQGFNSYTQQICVDDAVLIDPLRAENVVSNDGTTMRIMAQKEAKPSAWTRQREIITDERAVGDLKDKSVLNSVKAGETPEGVIKIDKAPGKPAESPTEEPLESKPTEEEADSEDVNTGDQPDAEASDTLVATAKSDSDSLDHIESQDLESNKQEATNETQDVTETVPTGDDATAKQLKSSASKAEAEAEAEKNVEKLTSGATHDPAEPGSPSNAASSAQKPSLTGGTAKRRRVRSSSVDAGKTSKPSEADVAPLRKAKVLPTTEKDRAPEGLREDPADVIARKKEEQATLTAQRNYQKQLEKDLREEESARRKEERGEQRTIRKEKRDFDATRRKEARDAISDAAKAKALSMADLQTILAQNQFVDRFSGMGENQQDFVFDSSGPRGPSQIVTYSSRFVDRLSDVTDEMCVSGSLSIKAAKLGGSGKGSFVDSDKFKESDLNFYISVKVVNHTVNFKDALVYNPLRSVDANDPDTFRKVYGDSFISGFMEGGEFNAIVSMKILNKAKKTDIKAEAKVAFTAGPVDITAEANVGIARSNIETNTETTIQVSWAGGGHIKPMDQQWDIKSLMQAASRFPDLVADCPQRTYAILTKYETLRSFVARQPATFSPLQYENAQIYTNTLLDSFMSYKALYKRLGEQVFNVQGKTLEIMPRSGKDEDSAKTSQAVEGTHVADLVSKGLKNTESGLYPFVDDMTPFEASLKGLSDARIAIRRQMARIVNEVTLIEADPKLATDEDHHDPFQSPIAFEVRLPEVGIPKRLITASEPLTGKRIIAKTQTEQELKDSAEKQEQLESLPSICAAGEDLSMEDQSALDKIKQQRPAIGTNLRVTAAVGTLTDELTSQFTCLDFIQPDWSLSQIRVEIAYGLVVAFWLHYDNGLIFSRGKSSDGRVVELNRFSMGEKIVAASVVTGASATGGKSRVIGLTLYTNRGRCLVGQASKISNEGGRKQSRDGRDYCEVDVKHFDSPLQGGSLKGFWGRSSSTNIYRLGLIWGDINKDPYNASTDLIDPFTAAKEDCLRSERNALWGNRSSSWRDDRVQIFHIIYGGHDLANMHTTAESFRDKARSGSSFQINITALGRDPVPGVPKTLFVLYRYDDTGPMRVLSGWDSHTVKFDPLPS